MGGRRVDEVTMEFRRLRRRFFYVALPVGAVAALAALVLLAVAPAPEPLEVALRALLAVWLFALTVWVWARRRVPRVVGVLAFAGVSAFVIADLIVPFVTTAAGGLAERAAVGWLPVLYVYAFVMFGLQRGVRLAGVLFGAFALVSLLVLPSVWGDVRAVAWLAQQWLVSVVLIVLLSMFAWFYRKRGGQARVLEGWANTDALTGVLSRRRIEQALADEVFRARRYERSVSVIITDVDRFKRVNDVFGHAVGDEVLRDFAFVLTQGLRRVDFVGRWGGEEFVLVLPEIGLEEAKVIADRLREEVEAHAFEPVGQLTASFGVASWSAGEDALSLVKRADAALYEAKEGGRNQVRTARSPRSG